MEPEKKEECEGNGKKTRKKKKTVKKRKRKVIEKLKEE